MGIFCFKYVISMLLEICRSKICSISFTFLSLCNLEAAPEEAMQFRRLIKSSKEGCWYWFCTKIEGSEGHKSSGNTLTHKKHVNENNNVPPKLYLPHCALCAAATLLLYIVASPLPENYSRIAACRIQLVRSGHISFRL